MHPLIALCPHIIKKAEKPTRTASLLNPYHMKGKGGDIHEKNFFSTAFTIYTISHLLLSEKSYISIHFFTILSIACFFKSPIVVLGIPNIFSTCLYVYPSRQVRIMIFRSKSSKLLMAISRSTLGIISSGKLIS
ncbi:hypothetical protein SAMN04489735_100245 [Aneurinibacillus thermoaerophilus]|uniref:Uncharacterized protein n=1 Tax=Aneurinibacillus thermoaerophilus TaxID=143495 RepID=A0A1G7WPI1_ANETH|nr:hypothetical protein SAMN04489735_100245 [Aneurinibacillus thermoaerophilus]